MKKYLNTFESFVSETQNPETLHEGLNMSVVNSLWSDISKLDNNQMFLLFDQFADKFKRMSVKPMEDAFQ